MIGDPLMGGSPLLTEGHMTPGEMQMLRNRLDDLEYLSRQETIVFLYDKERDQWWARVTVDEGWCISTVWHKVPDASQKTLSNLHADAAVKSATASRIFDDACD